MFSPLLRTPKVPESWIMIGSHIVGMEVVYYMFWVLGDEVVVFVAQVITFCQQDYFQTSRKQNSNTYYVISWQPLGATD